MSTYAHDAHVHFRQLTHHRLSHHRLVCTIGSNRDIRRIKGHIDRQHKILLVVRKFPAVDHVCASCVFHVDQHNFCDQHHALARNKAQTDAGGGSDKEGSQSYGNIDSAFGSAVFGLHQTSK